MIETRNFSIRILAIGLLCCTLACSNNNDLDETVAPTSENATFTYVFDSEDPNKVLFTGQPDVTTWYTHWSFGDNTSAEGMEVSKVYPLKGEYPVRFKIFTEGGTAESVQSIFIEADKLGPNLVLNSTFDGSDSWNILPITDGVDISFENEAVVWRGGSWGHAGIYQEVQLEANQTYQVNMDISGSGLTDCWFEVYVGTETPTPGVDYADGGIRLGINTWEGCGSEPFEGLLSNIACTGGDGTFEFSSAVTAYLVIRSGGVDFGETGVTVDNVSLRPL
jgi:hypothetical protein